MPLCQSLAAIPCYPSSPAWHRHVRRARHRARQSLQWPSELSACSLGRAVALLSQHHGSAASNLALLEVESRQMPGQWWRCRVCNQHTPRACRFCGSCGHPMQDLTKPQSTPQTPVYSQDCVVGHGWHNNFRPNYPARRHQQGNNAGGKSSTKGYSPQTGAISSVGRWKNARGNGMKQQQTDTSPGNVRWTRRNGSKKDDAPKPSACSGEDAEAADIKRQMQTLDAILSGLDGKEDPMAIMMRGSAQEQLKSLRHRLTALRPLPAQIATMEDYVVRKQSALAAAKLALEQAQMDLQTTEHELSSAVESLAALRERMTAEESIHVRNEAAQITGSQMVSLMSLAQHLPPQQAAAVKDVLLQLQPLLAAVGQTPFAAPVTPATTGPRSPEPSSKHPTPLRGRERSRSNRPPDSASRPRSVPHRLRAKSADPRGMPFQYPTPVNDKVFHLGISPTAPT